MKPEHEHDDEERGRGAEHPDLVLKGEEEHPLRPPPPVIDLDDEVDR